VVGILVVGILHRSLLVVGMGRIEFEEEFLLREFLFCGLCASR